MNRVCVSFGERLIPINGGSGFVRLTTGSVARIGDDAMALVTKDGVMREVMVRLLRSDGMVENPTYLVDLEGNEAWLFDINNKREAKGDE